MCKNFMEGKITFSLSLSLSLLDIFVCISASCIAARKLYSSHIVGRVLREKIKFSGQVRSRVYLADLGS